MGIFITAYKDRGIQESITIKDVNGVAVELATGDKIRVKIGRQGGTPSLDIVSGTALTGGTNTTAQNPTTLTIDRTDLANLANGVYDIEVGIVDASDLDGLGVARFKHAEQGIFTLIGTQGGGLT